MANERECPSCATMVSTDQRTCFICGYEFPGSSKRRRGFAIIALILVALFLIPLIRVVLRALN